MKVQNKEIQELENKMKGKYLTEESLGEFLKVLYPNKEWIHDQKFKTEGVTYNFRPDYCCHELKLCVEFDGPDHFTKANIIQADIKKDETLKELNYEVIRVPYFFQLDTEGISCLFELDVDINYGFKHGFISRNVTLPANFCEQGVWKFKDILSRLSRTASTPEAKYIFKQIRESLINKIKSSTLPEETARLTVVPSQAQLALGLEDSAFDNSRSEQWMLHCANISNSNLQNNWNCTILTSIDILLDQEVYDVRHTYNSEGNLSGYSFKMLHSSTVAKYTLLVERDLEEENKVNMYSYINDELAFRGDADPSEIGFYDLIDFLFP